VETRKRRTVIPVDPLRSATNNRAMPLFEYRCNDCTQQCELLIRGSAVPVCPSCGSQSLERLLSQFAVSSDGTSRRNRQTLGASNRAKAQSNRKEQEHYKHDHHDD
jgi:putative FmdB family regulatory protein